MKKVEDFIKEFDEELKGYFIYEYIRKFFEKLNFDIII